MIKSLSSSEEIVVQATTRNDLLTNQKLRNENGCDRIAGALSIKIPFSENVSKPASPAENEYGVLCQSSPSSDVSFGWEEVTVNTHLISRHSSYGIQRRNSSVNECSNSCEQRNGTTENSDSVASIERTLGKDVCCLGVTAASNFRESKGEVAHSIHMAIKPAVSEELVRNIYRMKEKHISESEDSDSISTCHDVPRREGSGSDTTDDFIEMSSLLSNEEYSPVTIGGASELENLTEEEEIWMIQCPVSINPQDLQNEELVFGGKSGFTLQLGDVEKYETACYVDRKKSVPCLLPSRKKSSFKAKVLQPEGLIVITEKVEIPELKITLPKQSNFQIPEGLTVRHPLFGRDYKEELSVQKGFTSQHRRMIHEDLLTQPNRIKKEKKKDRRSERRNLQTSDGWHQDSYHKNQKKNKKKHCEAEECKRKRKLDEEDIFEGSELLDTKRRKKISTRKCSST